MTAKRWTFLVVGIVYLLAQAGAALHTLHEDAFCAECDSGQVRIRAGGEDDHHHHHHHERHHCRICTGELQAAESVPADTVDALVVIPTSSFERNPTIEPVTVHADSRAPPATLPGIEG